MAQATAQGLSPDNVITAVGPGPQGPRIPPGLRTPAPPPPNGTALVQPLALLWPRPAPWQAQVLRAPHTLPLFSVSLGDSAKPGLLLQEAPTGDPLPTQLLDWGQRELHASQRQTQAQPASGSSGSPSWPLCLSSSSACWRLEQSGARGLSSLGTNGTGCWTLRG